MLILPRLNHYIIEWIVGIEHRKRLLDAKRHAIIQTRKQLCYKVVSLPKLAKEGRWCI